MLCYGGDVCTGCVITLVSNPSQLHVWVQIQIIQIKKRLLLHKKIDITTTIADMNSHLYMVMEGNMQFIYIFYLCVHVTTNDVPSQSPCYHTKNNLSCTAKGGKETQVGLWAPNLIHSIKSYTVCIRVKSIDIDWIMQKRCNSSVLARELHLLHNRPSIYTSVHKK